MDRFNIMALGFMLTLCSTAYAADKKMEIRAAAPTESSLECDIRSSAQLMTINHSLFLGTPKDPNSKADYDRPMLPGPREGTPPSGCVYAIGYWGAKPGIEWPRGYDRDALFFSSPDTWGQILPPISFGPNSNGYYQLARQYIGAVLNVANGASVPSGIQDILDKANYFFNNSTPASCPLPDSCRIQKTWAWILKDYNSGEYGGGPARCGNE